MTWLLAIETSTLTSSAALLEGERVVVEKSAAASQTSEALLPLIDEVLRAGGKQPAELDLVACGAGPGSFTGLRIGLATAKGLCFALGKPMLAVSSLAALALEAGAPGALVLAVVDARRGEVYAGLFRGRADGTPESLLEEAVFTPDAIVARVRELAAGAPVAVVGDGVPVAPEIFAALGATPADASIVPRAQAVGRIASARWRAGAVDELGTATPAYIRLAEAEAKLTPR
jgi:tRNA threonylcarbamoyladenosine biosynthesis protein TsaB